MESRQRPRRMPPYRRRIADTGFCRRPAAIGDRGRRDGSVDGEVIGLPDTHGDAPSQPEHKAIPGLAAGSCPKPCRPVAPGRTLQCRKAKPPNIRETRICTCRHGTRRPFPVGRAGAHCRAGTATSCGPGKPPGTSLLFVRRSGLLRGSGEGSSCGPASAGPAAQISGGPPSACGRGAHGLPRPRAPCRKPPCRARKSACGPPDRRSG